LGGITGIVHFKGEPPDREQVMQLSTGVAHRGPDDKTLIYEPPVGLAQRVFSTEREATKPPFDDGRYVILLDGGANRERLLDGWAKSGTEALNQVPGAFAIAVWDRAERALWLARDPAGTRPLFFSHKDQKLAFSSAIRPLLGLEWVSKEIAADHLAEYLSFRYIHAPRTLLREVHSVPPGHVARISASGIRIQRWWNPAWWMPGESVPEFPMIMDRVDTALRRAVERRLRTDQPTGVLLSGGLDSAAILHHASAVRGDPLPTYTVAMSGDKTDESAFAARVAKTYAASHTLIEISNNDLAAAVDTATLHMGQPLPSPAALVQMCLFKKINSDVKILLSGAGGDEVLGGRTMPQIAQRLRRSRTVGRLPGPARLVGMAVARKAGWSDLASASAHFGLERKIGGSRVFSAEDRVDLLRDPAMARPGIRAAILEPFYQEVSSDPINEILHVWQRGWLSEDVLSRTDRMAAACGIHTRFPMLDSEFLTTAAGIPGPEKCRRKGVGYIAKAPLRGAMQGRLSERLLNRPKRAEPKPMADWTRGPGAKFLRERIETTAERCSDLFVPTWLRERMNIHMSGQADLSMQLWTLMMFDAWRASLD
jgi:asparagine synthase (glutamine-hydrolysing)